jgi:hypothetical protein
MFAVYVARAERRRAMKSCPIRNSLLVDGPISDITQSDEVITKRAGRPANGEIFRLVCAGRRPVGRFESLTAMRQNRYCRPGPVKTNSSFVALRGECQRDVVFI